MCCDDDEVEDAELGSVGGGTEDLRRNSERFLRISSREATLEGLERDGFKGFERFDGFVGLRCPCCCCCLRLALTSEK